MEENLTREAKLNIKRNTTQIKALLFVWVIFQLYYTTVGSLDAIIFRAWHALFLILFTFLLYPNVSSKKVKNVVNVILIVLAFFSFGYMILNYNRISISGGFLSTLDKVVAFIGIVVVLEAGRRVSKNLAILSMIFLSYLFWGKYISGPLSTSTFSLNRVLSHMFWGSQGIFGIGIGVSATYIFLFVIFGSFLKHSGFSELINDLSLAIVGKSPGGPAKVAVIASALMGMINGSAIANVATTGTITIPLMKKTGYSSEFSGAVEAVASTGGQFCPPIMGAVGFVMAEYLGVPYTKVMIAAILPAFLFYLGILLAVHFEAKKLGLSGISKENIPKVKDVLKSRGHLIIPLAVLLIMMFTGFTPIFAAVASIFSTIIAAGLRKETRMNLLDIVEASVDGARSAIGVGISCVLIGLIVGTVSLSGLGLNFGNLILKISGGGNLYIVGILVMIMSVILGMGVPGVAAYVIVVAVSVPVLVSAGALPLTAHMFCLIYACLSNITPPVAMSSYIASGIAESNITKTSLIAVKIGVIGFIIPFFFLKNPVLLLDQPSLSADVLRVIASSIVGVISIVMGFSGILFKKMRIIERIILFIGGLMTIDVGFMTDIYGFIMISMVVFIQLIANKGNIEQKYGKS